MMLTLRPEGQRLLQEMLPGVCREVTALFAGFTGTDKEQMLQFFKRLLAGIDALGAREPAGDDAS
jgi:DNA-binding MarR family transcriptional regulator